MSSNLMDTSPGGENTPYESIKTVTEPPAKQGGQLGEATTTSPTSQPQTANKTSTTGLTPADKIRFGQAISEEGVGGQTGPGHSIEEGTTSHEGGHGGTEALKQDPETGDAARSRREQGYGGQKDMARDVGA